MHLLDESPYIFDLYLETHYTSCDDEHLTRDAELQ